MERQIDTAMRVFARMVAEELVKIQWSGKSQQEAKESRRFKGVKGIMEIFQCSRSKACRIKESGVIDGAITHINGRLFLVDEQKALQAFENRKGGRRY